MKKLICLISLLCTALPAAISYAGASPKHQSLIVYSGRSDKFVKPLVTAFTEKTGIKVQLYNAPATSLLNKLLIEQSRTPADLFLSNDAGTLQVGQQKGLFKPLPEKLVAPIEKKFRASDNSWVGLSGRARMIVVNKKAKQAQNIRSIRDLAKPKYQGKLAITSSANGSFIAGTSVYLLEMGEKNTQQWLEGIKDNANGRAFNKHSRIVKAVANGQYDAGLINHYYFYRHLVKHPDAPIALIVPDQEKGGMGVAWNVAGIALSKYSKHVAAAEKFIEFLVSKQGQHLFSSVNKEFPTRRDAELSPELKPLGRIKIADVAMSELGKQRRATLDLIEKVGLQ